MNEYKTAPQTRNVVTGVLASGDLRRPLYAAGCARSSYQILRDAFRKTVTDPAFLADVKTRKLEVNPTYGEELEVIAREAASQPREIVERMKTILGD